MDANTSQFRQANHAVSLRGRLPARHHSDIAIYSVTDDTNTVVRVTNDYWESRSNNTLFHGADVQFTAQSIGGSIVGRLYPD